MLRASEVLMGATDDDGAPGLPVSFRSAMDEDLAVPAALAAVHAIVRDGMDQIGVQVEDTPQGPRWELKR